VNPKWSARPPHIVPILATMLASCASSPVVIFEGEEELPVVAGHGEAHKATDMCRYGFVAPTLKPIEPD